MGEGLPPGFLAWSNVPLSPIAREDFGYINISCAPAEAQKTLCLLDKKKSTVSWGSHLPSLGFAISPCWQGSGIHPLGWLPPELTAGEPSRLLGSDAWRPADGNSPGCLASAQRA